MSGWAGCLEWGQLQFARLSEGLKCLGHAFYQERTRSVGICWQGDAIYYALAEKQGDAVRLLRLAKDHLPTEGISGMQENERRQEYASRAAMGLARQGWGGECIACCLPDKDIRCYLVDLPAQMTPAEKKEAAYWEVDGRLLEEGLSAEDFSFGWHLPEQGHSLALSVPQATLAAWKRCCEAEDMQVAAWVAEIPEGMGEAAPAALILQETLPESLAGFREQDIPGAGGAIGAAFWGLGRISAFVLGISSANPAEQGPQWAWRRLAAAAAALTLMVLLFWGSWAGMAAYEARQERQAVSQQLLAMAPDRKAMQVLESARQSTAARDATLQQLGQDALPWYSILLYLGSPSLSIEGIWLQDLKLGRDQSLELSGTALTYAALAEYMEAFRHEPAPLGIPLLAKAEHEAGEGRGEIRFRLVLKP